MATRCYSAIDNCGAQFNRLDCDGNILNGAEDVVVTCALVDYSVQPIRGEDRTSTDANGSGGNCATRKDEGKVEEYEVTLTLCSKTDIELMELLGLWDKVIDPATGDTVGWKPLDEGETCYCAPPEGGCTNPGVSMLLWHVAWCGEEQLTDLPFVNEAFTKVKFDAGSITRTRNSEFNTYEVTGTATTNPNWGQGPGNIYPEVAGLGVPSAEWNTATPPPNGCDCEACGYATEYVGAA